MLETLIEVNTHLTDAWAVARNYEGIIGNHMLMGTEDEKLYTSILRKCSINYLVTDSTHSFVSLI